MEACKKLSADMDDNLEKLASKAYKGGVNAVAGLIKGITDAVAAKDTDTELTRLEATFAKVAAHRRKRKKIRRHQPLRFQQLSKKQNPAQQKQQNISELKIPRNNYKTLSKLQQRI